MTISYNWLSEYLPEVIASEKLSKILTSIGLEVESMEKFESIKGGLKGLIAGEILTCEQHPNADKLKLTAVNIGSDETLQIVCGAPNAGAGQKVIIAPVGATIYPANKQPIIMKAATIRGLESQGMICAEDEIGMGTDHSGIIVLPDSVKPGTPANKYFGAYEDWIFEIGLTPNRMDAMSHYGVAKDVCAWLSYHNKSDAKPISPFKNNFKSDNNDHPIKVTIENKNACERYAGVSIRGVEIKESPQWLKNKLIAIGQRPVNNIVDITNFILHETGQPLHAFDADAIIGNEIIVKNLPEGTAFISLDEKERKLFGEDLMICNAEDGMCIAGVFGGLKSGVKNSTKNIFLESAWFNPTGIRKTSLRHGLRTEAAARFEKGVDISNVVNVLKRAALMIKEIAGGEISSSIVDVYPNPKEKTQVAIKYHYLKKISGKNYHPDAVKKILSSLGFDILREGMDELLVAVPFSKPDISLPADIAEEVLRIDGLDNIEIPAAITITPAVDKNAHKETLKEKIADYLVGLGFNEIITNSITNSRYYNEAQLGSAVKMINNLSADLDVMRVSMAEPGLETIAYNINRKNNNLQFFEFGKTYHSKKIGEYEEDEHLSLYITGNIKPDAWKSKSIAADFYTAKGIASAILQLCSISNLNFQLENDSDHSLEITHTINNIQLVKVAEISNRQLSDFGIKQPVYFIDINWKLAVELSINNKITYTEVNKYPAVHRDVAMVVDRDLTYEAVETSVKKAMLAKLKNVQLFDIFESDKLGADKKSMAISFTFCDEEKTLTDNEVDEMLNKLIKNFESELSAEIRSK